MVRGVRLLLRFGWRALCGAAAPGHATRSSESEQWGIVVLVCDNRGMSSLVGITARMAARQQEIRALYAEQLDDIMVLDREPVQNMKRLVAETLRVTPKKAARMIEQARLLAEVPTLTGHLTPAVLPVVREAARAGEVDDEHIHEIARTLEGLPAGISVADRDLLETTLVDTARVHHAQIVRRHGDRIVAHVEQNEPAAEREQAEP